MVVGQANVVGPTSIESRAVILVVPVMTACAEVRYDMKMWYVHELCA